MIYIQLIFSFLKVGLFSIGGGYAAMPLIQSEVVVKYGWLTMKEFTDLITIAEMTPGPIAINAATFVGIRIAGLLGALFATFGCIIPSCLIVSFLYSIYFRYKDVSILQCVLNSLRPAVVALIAAAGLSILQLVVFQGKKMGISTVRWDGLIIFCTAFFVLRKLRWNPIFVMVLCSLTEFTLHFMQRMI